LALGRKTKTHCCSIWVTTKSTILDGLNLILGYYFSCNFVICCFIVKLPKVIDNDFLKYENKFSVFKNTLGYCIFHIFIVHYFNFWFALLGFVSVIVICKNYQNLKCELEVDVNNCVTMCNSWNHPSFEKNGLCIFNACLIENLHKTQ
jgi:hypothetical protein